MASVTVASLKSKAKQKANMENSSFVSDAELLGYINEGNAAYYDIIVSKFEDYYLADPTTFTLTSGQSTYTLDADFYKLVGVDRSEGGNNWYPLEQSPWRSRNRQTSNYYYNRSYQPRVGYRLTGNKLRFTPEDNAAGDYRYWYIPLATILTDDADTIEDYNGFSEIVSIEAAIRMLAKEESDISYLLAERARIENRINTMAQIRDTNSHGGIEEINTGLYDDEGLYF